MIHIRSVLSVCIFLWVCINTTWARPRPGTIVPGTAPGTNTASGVLAGEVLNSKSSSDDTPAGEPSCDQLRAMWRFSKRQSRAAEMTNEIPSYRDPFINNVWQAPFDTYARSRSLGGMRVGYRGYRPVYGRVVHKAPRARVISHPERNRAMEEVIRLYGDSTRNGFLMGNAPSNRRQTQFRLSGGYVGRNINQTPHSGSFQHLKELIRTERARELQQQRLAEEMAARAAVLKASGGDLNSRRHASSKYAYETNGDEDVMNDEGSMRDYMMVGYDSGDTNNNAPVLTFPDPVAPPASMLRSTNPRFYDKQNLDEDNSYFDSDFSDTDESL
ncbi:uncharacterized protein LOC123302558 [Chrysoperla carnea]|uniref:uncharacterized protein LOC123302558 n=1 Tax=Chrysoperla carnea TaxID=189513 RepID=UPI001D094DAA|nr:uncharacterized protein LOC123302558 [Chrysoperla carnea]